MAGLLILAALSPSSSLTLARMVLQSAGIGIFNAPNNSSILSAVKQSKHGVITGFLNLVRNAGNLCSVAIGTATAAGTMASLRRPRPYPPYPPSAAMKSYRRSQPACAVLIGVAASAFKGKRIAVAEG